MAKRNKSKAKQRKKKHLRKRIFATSKVVPTVKVQAAPPPVSLYLGKYAAENEEYQKALDAIYQGNIKPYDRYVNPNVVLKHRCTHCKSKFYARPKWLIGEQPHVCFKPPAGGQSDNVKLKKVKDTTWEEFQQMVWDDLTYREIAKKMGVDPKIIKMYFVRERLI